MEVRFSFPEEGSLAQFDSYRVVLLKKGTTNQAFEANVTHNVSISGTEMDLGELSRETEKKNPTKTTNFEN